MKLALGTAQFGLDYGIGNQRGQVSQNEVRLIMTHAKSHGIDTLDTAITYGNAEHRLGEIGVSGWLVVSKLPAVPADCQEVEAWVCSEVRASLERLRITKLHGLLLHRPEQLHGVQGRRIHDALLTLKHQALVDKIGVSIYDPNELDLLTHFFLPDLVQAPFNFFDRRLVESGWLRRISEMNIELHVRSVFLQGLLLMSSTNRPEKFNRWQALWQRWEQWLLETGQTPLQACLRDVLTQAGIARVIVGVDSLRHMQEILLATSGAAIERPEDIRCHDIDLINPARWGSL